VGGGAQTGSTRHVGHFWPIVSAPGDCENGEFGRIKIGRGNQSIRRKPTPAPLCPPQILLEQTRARARAAEVGSQRLTAWAMARHCVVGYMRLLFQKIANSRLDVPSKMRHTWYITLHRQHGTYASWHHIFLFLAYYKEFYIIFLEHCPVWSIDFWRFNLLLYG
jgi:hypothetical protein